ncbi:uncharacterized protein C1orf141 homolog [Tachyglossus aculeatus]|uniref:uncharacterized protein C1orf141 homolog n=1 Tax=Tachyglossus aculeatus TaxID=9261 RepID=UPI0018F663F9|nr:uncharacterized protein C1orf141 homolog [Tachyglossus aculeatus]XP_038609054.1 uncharacterized protein C1orf141 homolog [Tachyglossus aculeatus]XP_038609055.1 uncharacterized protein C1orf141 homolog [Tachyglossus aculeatus]
MTQRLLDRLDVLNLYSEKILAKRAKKQKLQKIQLGNKLATPLTFEFQLDFDLPIVKGRTMSKPKAGAQVIEDGPDINDQRIRSPPLTSGPKPRNTFPRQSKGRLLSVPAALERKISPTGEKPEPNGNFGKTERLVTQKCQNDDEHGIHFQEDNKEARKKADPEEDISSLKDRGNFKNIQAAGNDLSGQKNPISLSIEDELKNPNAKIIGIRPPEVTVSQPNMNKTYPVTYHEEAEIQMFLLTKMLSSAEYRKLRNWEVGKKQRSAKVNLVLEKNCESVIALVHDQSHPTIEKKVKGPSSHGGRRNNSPFLPDVRNATVAISQQGKAGCCNSVSNYLGGELPTGQLSSQDVTVPEAKGFIDGLVVQGIKSKADKQRGSTATLKSFSSSKCSTSRIYRPISHSDFPKNSRRASVSQLEYLLICKSINILEKAESSVHKGAVTCAAENKEASTLPEGFETPGADQGKERLMDENKPNEHPQEAKP